MRTGEGRMAVTTDMDKVQKEIAIMKKIVHPNLVHLFEVSCVVLLTPLRPSMRALPG
jgi:broad-specificity NMP kinase